MSQFITSFDHSGWADEMTTKLAELKEALEDLEGTVELIQGFIVHEVR